MRRRLYILGTGGLARELAMLAEQVNAQEPHWDFGGFITQDRSELGKDLGTGKIIGDDAWLLDQKLPADIVIGIGTPAVRRKAVAPYITHKDRFSFPNLVHPSATLDVRRVALGVGNAVTAGCIFTCDIRVKDFNVFNLNVTIGHDCRFGSYNVVNPGANVSGEVIVGDDVLFGTGCQILQGRSVDSGATIGAGAMVRTDVSGGQTVVGVPAIPIVTRPRVN